MIKKIAFVLLILLAFDGFSQNTDEKELVVLTFEIEENFSSHPDTRFYWVTELKSLENLNDYEKQPFYPIFFERRLQQ